MTYGCYTSGIRITYEWHANDMRFERKIKLAFLKVFINYLSKYLISQRSPCMQWLFWVIYQNKKGSGISFWCTYSTWFFTNAPYLIL